MKDVWSKHPREIAIDEGSAVLVDGDGKVSIVGTGKGVYFIRPTRAPEVCKSGAPLRFDGVAVYKAPAGSHFDLRSWTGTGGVTYSLSVEEGAIRSSAPGTAVY
jgi:cyanophycinase-like exopeptidase